MPRTADFSVSSMRRPPSSATTRSNASPDDTWLYIEAGLIPSARATLEIAILPLEEPSDDLEQRILDAALEAHEGEPMLRRVITVIAWAGSNVMRPQFAMAALLMLVLGSSVLLCP